MQLVHQSPVGLDQGVEVCSRTLGATEKGCLHAECCTNTSKLSNHLTPLLHDTGANPKKLQGDSPLFAQSHSVLAGAPVPTRRIRYSLLQVELRLITRISRNIVVAL
jgi:hypothetical protein